MIPKSNKERAAEAVRYVEYDLDGKPTRDSAALIFGVRTVGGEGQVDALRRSLERFLDDLDRERTPPPVKNYECGFCGETNEVRV